MSIITKTGDNGTTGLYGGMRISKSDLRMHAIGTVDELNALLGVILSAATDETFCALITRIQHQLFHVGADLATPLPGPANAKRIQPAESHELEAHVQELERTLPPLTAFILPSGSSLGSLLHHARTVCRRAERWGVALREQEDITAEILIYLNRLSDLLFLLARAANINAGAEETKVKY